MLKKIFLLTLIFFLFLFSFGIIEARGPRSNQMWPASPLGTEITEIYDGRTYFREDVDISIIIQYFFEWMIVLGGLVAFIAFIWAGILYMTSVGDANKMSEAKKKIRNALLGLILLMLSYLIFYTINPELTRLGRVVEQPVNDIVLKQETQEQIAFFIEVYTQCYVFQVKKEQMVIHIPLPLIGGDISITRLFGISEPRFSYKSFCGGFPITTCQALSNVINSDCKFGNNSFKINEININNYPDLIRVLRLPGYLTTPFLP